MTCDRNELFISTRMLNSHNKKGSPENTWLRCLALLRLDSHDSTHPIDHIGTSSNWPSRWCISRVDLPTFRKFIFFFFFIKLKPDWTPLRKLKWYKTHTGRGNKRKRPFIDYRQIALRSRSGRFVFSVICTECFPLVRILLLANSNHSPEGHFPWLNEVPQVQWTAEEMNRFFPTCKTITGKEQRKHLAFFSLENVKQRVPHYGAGFEV